MMRRADGRRGTRANCLRSPAMEAGIADRVWSLEEIVNLLA